MLTRRARDAANAEATREANNPAYHNSMKERYRTRCGKTGAQQSRKSARKNYTDVNHLVTKK